MPVSGTRTDVSNMAALWILVSSLVPLPSFYGAIAYDRQGGAYGFAYDQPSPVAAGRRALDKCGSPGCALVLEFADGCGAYATGPNAAAGAGNDYTRTTAEDRALAQCRSAGVNCQVKVWTCNRRPARSRLPCPWNRLTTVSTSGRRRDSSGAWGGTPPSVAFAIFAACGSMPAACDSIPVVQR